MTEEKVFEILGNERKSVDLFFTKENIYQFFKAIFDMTEEKKKELRELVKNNLTFITVTHEDFREVFFGIEQLWKSYDSISDFEAHYTQSDMMRTLYAGEYENDEPVKIYIDIEGKKYEVVWSIENGNDAFSYKAIDYSTEYGMKKVGIAEIILELELPFFIVCSDEISLRNWRKISEDLGLLEINNPKGKGKIVIQCRDYIRKREV